MTIFFGANDARLPNTPGGPQQHVPEDQYKENLRSIAMHECVKAHYGIRLILVTPPPVDERKLMQADEEKYGLGPMLRRRAATTSRYAQVVRDLGEELSIPVLDIWSAMTKRAGHAAQSHSDETGLPGSTDALENHTLRAFLRDGLHFSCAGYEVLFEELMGLMERNWPDQLPSKLPFVFPAWDDETAWQDGTLQECKPFL